MLQTGGFDLSPRSASASLASGFDLYLIGMGLQGSLEGVNVPWLFQHYWWAEGCPWDTATVHQSRCCFWQGSDCYSRRSWIKMLAHLENCAVLLSEKVCGTVIFRHSLLKEICQRQFPHPWPCPAEAERCTIDGRREAGASGGATQGAAPGTCAVASAQPSLLATCAAMPVAGAQVWMLGRRSPFKISSFVFPAVAAALAE